MYRMPVIPLINYPKGYVMNYEQAIAYLTRDRGAVPCSRYGCGSDDCAPVAYEVARIWADSSGDPIDVDSLDGAMGLVVNDSDSVLELILEHGNVELLEDAALEDHFASEAARIGKNHAISAASWAGDGFEDSMLRMVLHFLEDGDPLGYDSIPMPPDLSGEWADGATIVQLADDIGVPDPRNMPDELLEAICDGYEQAVSEHFEAECVRVMQGRLGEDS